tara:strand:+ start:8308 stop:10062 length:1755 start_codon:yes stop_codon:yes gene_type:complete
MNLDSLIETYYKQAENEVLVNEVLRFLTAPPLTEDKGARARDRVIRLPNLMATEISVGQKPDSEDRRQFEIWMQNIGVAEGGVDASAVSRKLSALTEFFANPQENLKNANIPTMLSYLMFLNQFVYMLKEFNASVAGFLWEPFLAALFGGKSIQVPTSKGDIADIRIYAMGNKDMPISLKILNKAGYVKGSFSDLVKHFAEKDGKEMRYIIVVKDQSSVKKQISGVTFYEFNITADSFFEWIGNVAYGETIISKEKSFKAQRDLKKVWLKLVGGADARYQILHATHGVSQKTGERTGKVGAAWVSIAFLNKEDKQYYINPEGAQEVNLRSPDGTPALEGLFDPSAEYIADIAERTGGGKGGATMQKGYEAMPGTETTDTKKLWGGKDELAAWSNLATSLKEAGHPPSVFFQAVLGNPPPEGFDWPGQAAPGARKSRGKSSDEKGGTQFHIGPTHYKGLGIGGKDGIGSIKITDAKVVEFFEEAAANMNEELVTMFNKLADLNDNIGRFFLANCGDAEGGGGTCTDADAAARGRYGQEAMNDAQELEDAVVKSVSGQMGSGEGHTFGAAGKQRAVQGKYGGRWEE